MTHRQDVARGRDVVARWCALAERRLEYLTQLFETGRWRRYHSELAFLQNIQEAKSAVEIWRDLSTREAARDNSAIDISWLGRAPATLPRNARLRDRVQPHAVQIPAEPRREIPVAAALVSSGEAAPVRRAAPPPRMAELTLDLDGIQARYPLLRNTF
jgi:uncharacterized repeat protein (TIGR03809 family)